MQRGVDRLPPSAGVAELKYKRDLLVISPLAHSIRELLVITPLVHSI